MAKKILIFVLVVFSLITLFVSSSVLFDWFGFREKEGNFVNKVVWANWFCGVLYLLSAYQIGTGKQVAVKVLSISLAVLVLAYIYLFVHISSGGLYEKKTVIAMAFRTLVTTALLFTTIKIHKK